MMIISERNPHTKYECSLEPIQPSIRQAPAGKPLAPEPGWADRSMERLYDAGGALKKMGFGYQPDQKNSTMETLKHGGHIIDGLSDYAENRSGKPLSALGKFGNRAAGVFSTVTSVPNLLVSLHNDKQNGVQVSGATVGEAVLSTAQGGSLYLIGGALATGATKLTAGLAIAAVAKPAIVIGGVIVAGYLIGAGANKIRDFMHKQPIPNDPTHVLVCRKIETTGVATESK